VARRLRPRSRRGGVSGVNSPSEHSQHFERLTSGAGSGRKVMTYEQPPSWWDKLYVRWLLLPVAYIVGMFITARFRDGTVYGTPTPANIGAIHMGAFVFAALYWQIAKDKKVRPFTRWALLPYVFVATKWVVGWLLFVPIAAMVLVFSTVPDDGVGPATRLVLNLSGLVSCFIWWRVTRRK